MLVALAAVSALVLLGGCSAIRATFDTDQALHRAGFSRASVTAHINNSFTTVEVEGVDSGDGERAAGVVWRTFRYRIDAIVVGGDTFARPQLLELFGPRDPAYDRRTFGGELTRIGKAILAAVGAGALVIAGVLVLLIFYFIRRGSRQNATAAPS